MFSCTFWFPRIRRKVFVMHFNLGTTYTCMHYYLLFYSVKNIYFSWCSLGGSKYMVLEWFFISLSVGFSQALKSHTPCTSWEMGFGFRLWLSFCKRSMHINLEISYKTSCKKEIYSYMKSRYLEWFTIILTYSIRYFWKDLVYVFMHVSYR